MKKLFLLLAAIVTLALSASAQNRTYNGTVLSSADDEPLAGATVKPVGVKANGVMTNVDGEFTISVPANVKEVTVSYVGMKTVTVALSNNMKVKLENDAMVLDQVVVTGYGTGKKLGSVVGSVTVVGNEVMEETPSANFVDALQGQVAGLAIFSNTGEPTAVADIRIRGVNSLSGTTPLFICDGAPTTSSIFNTLNPSDIESVTVLKDASATAIYGSRAANGVIVITTKKGQYGENAKVSLRASYGWSSMANDDIDMMSSQQFVQFRDLVGAPVSDEVRNLVNTYGINTDWKDYIISNDAPTYRIEGRIQGGTDKTRYYLSLSHYDQQGLIDCSGIARQTLRFNLDSKIKPWLTVGLSANLGFETYESNNAAEANGVYTNNPFLQMYTLLPYDSPYYYSFNQNGDIVFGDRARYYHYSQTADPNYLNQKYFRSKRTNLTGVMTLYEQINPIKGLTLRAQQNVNAFDYRNSAMRPPYENEVTPMGDLIDFSDVSVYASEAFQRYYQFTYTNTAEYKATINDVHDFSVLIGQESIISRSMNFSVQSTGQPDADRNLLTQGTNVDISEGLKHGKSESIINSYFMTGTYSFDNRYFFDFSVRRDGSSKFAPEHRWGTFYSVGAMWDAKNEKFLQDVDWLSQLRVRANYGAAGNSSGIGNYDYIGTVTSGSIYDGETSMGISGLANSDLTWETVKGFNAGVDVEFFKRLRANVDFYIKNTYDMLMTVPVSTTTGWTSKVSNCGSMRNVGVDVTVGADIYQSKDWYVGADVNFNYNKNTITELFNGLESFTQPGTGVTYRIGQNPYTLNNVRYAGVDPRDGQQMWYTKDGNLTKKYNEADEVDLKKSFIAPWNGGFGVNARWKGLSVRADFNWSAEKYIFNATNWYIKDPTTSVARNTNASVELLNVWTKPGDVTNIPNRFDLYGQTQEIQADSRFVEDCSFLRLKNLTVSYSLPKSWLNAVKLSDVSFHFTGRNLWTLTEFKGVDPEYEGNVCHIMYPNTRQYEFGVEVSF